MKSSNHYRILFIGGTGTISTAVTELLSREGADLYLFNRGNKTERVPRGVKLINGDIRDIETAEKVLKDFEFDIVADWVAYNPEHILNDIGLFGKNLKQYIFISSASAYEKPPSHYLIKETTPLSNPYSKYAREKAACEKVLMDEYNNNNFPCTIIRPSYTYYRSIPFILNSKTHPWTIIDRMLKGKKIIVPGDGTSLWTLTHAVDFAKGFAGLLGNERAIGEVFHITSDEVLTWDKITDAIADAAGINPDIIHIPSDFICYYEPEYIAGLMGDKAVSVVFDNSKIKNFVPRFSADILFKDGIKHSIEWFKSNPALCSVDDGFNKLCDEIIFSYERGFTQKE
jgi:nucleoside-diphosphate-sugar epimerase